jgi:hypothetical protein
MNVPEDVGRSRATERRFNALGKKGTADGTFIACDLLVVEANEVTVVCFQPGGA